MPYLSKIWFHLKMHNRTCWTFMCDYVYFRKILWQKSRNLIRYIHGRKAKYFCINYIYLFTVSHKSSVCERLFVYEWLNKKRTRHLKFSSRFLSFHKSIPSFVVCSKFCTYFIIIAVKPHTFRCVDVRQSSQSTLWLNIFFNNTLWNLSNTTSKISIRPNNSSFPIELRQ